MLLDPHVRSTMPCRRSLQDALPQCFLGEAGTKVALPINEGLRCDILTHHLAINSMDFLQEEQIAGM